MQADADLAVCQVAAGGIGDQSELVGRHLMELCEAIGVPEYQLVGGRSVGRSVMTSARVALLRAPDPLDS